MYRRIVTPLDGSVFAEQALPVAGAIARRSGAVLTLVRVHHPLVYGEMAGAARWDADERQIEGEYLAQTAARVSECFSVVAGTALLEEPVVGAICDFTREHDSDLVVMSTHGRTGFSRAWLGSVADAVVRHITKPVLMVRPRDQWSTVELEDERDRVFSRVLVPLDGSRLAESILPHAAALTSTLQGGLSLLRVVEPVVVKAAEYPLEYPSFLTTTDREATDRTVEQARVYVTAVAARLRDEYGLDVSADVRLAERVAPAISEFARESEADLIALATHGRGASRLVVGSIADKVLRAGPPAVLLFHPAEAPKERLAPQLHAAATAG
jgi:nucleotide-binding universal stress UspA family protein